MGAYMEQLRECNCTHQDRITMPEALNVLDRTKHRGKPYQFLKARYRPEFPSRSAAYEAGASAEQERKGAKLCASAMSLCDISQVPRGEPSGERGKNHCHG